MFFFICALNKWFSKQSWGWGFEMPSRSLWRHCNVNQSWDFTEYTHGQVTYCLLYLKEIDRILTVSHCIYLAPYWYFIKVTKYRDKNVLVRLADSVKDNTEKSFVSKVSGQSYIQKLSLFLLSNSIRDQFTLPFENKSRFKWRRVWTVCTILCVFKANKGPWFYDWL